MTVLGNPQSVFCERVERDLSGLEWGIVRDWDARWLDDDLYPPPADIARLPYNPPSFGWDALDERTEKTVHLPATVEQYFWGDNGNSESVGGDYRGVSWFFTTIVLDESYRGRRLYLDFESVHLRAEVFVNRQLCGYDMVGHTPFSVDVTEAAKIGGENEIAVRITDPGGNFWWDDRAVMTWGRYDLPAAHGFGGITGEVTLRAVGEVFVDDIYVANKKDITDADIQVTLSNPGGRIISGSLRIDISRRGYSSAPEWSIDRKIKVSGAKSTVTIPVHMPDALPWAPDNPNLYVCTATFLSADGTVIDSSEQQFGFRWFEVREHDGDLRLYLNGRRIVLLGGMTWGFWPVNGVFPTLEMARRDIESAKALGLNYINFHRAIGQPGLMDAADESGILTYEEAGGYSCEGAEESQTLWRVLRREKLIRMILRDRSRPSLFMYNLQNRTPNPVATEDIVNMKMARDIDPTRIFTFISGFWNEPPLTSPDKLHYVPADTTSHFTGWYDMHNHTPAQTYLDRFYNAPDDYLRYADNSGEVIFWGEDGGLYAPPQLGSIAAYHTGTPAIQGWQSERYISWYQSWDRFLDRSGFREYFPDVDAFAGSMGATTLYYHGRIIENIRAGNTGDTYTINGWAPPRLFNQAAIVDLYRNPVGDSGIMARYCRPLYVAVKLRNKVLEANDTAIADIYLVNEKNVAGAHRLKLSLTGPDGGERWTDDLPVTIEGGENYGQLLAEGVQIPIGGKSGRYVLNAGLFDRNRAIVAEGNDDVFTVDVPPVLTGLRIACLDSSETLAAALDGIGHGHSYDTSLRELTYDVILVGRGVSMTGDIMSRVADGAVTVVFEHAEDAAQTLSTPQYQAISYTGGFGLRFGKYVAGRHPLLDGLPQAQACGWEYQCFTDFRGGNHRGMLIDGGETVIAAVADSRMEVASALTVVPYGRGAVVLSSLNMMPNLESIEPSAVVARRFLANCLRWAGER